MASTLSAQPRQVCEDILRKGRAYNIERGILPSENAVADRMLARGLELADAYGELHDTLQGERIPLQVALGLVLSTAAHWSPAKIAQARAARAQLLDVNQRIAQQAESLAALLEQRDTLHNTAGFSTETHYHVCDVIDAAGGRNGWFRSHVQERLHTLQSQFDLKYWPSPGDFVRELGIDAASASSPEATDPLTAAATSSTRHSLADYFRALLAAIDENSTRAFGQLPRGFRVSDSSLADLANCALGLGPDDLVDGPYVKRLRQRLRQEDRSGSLGGQL